MVKVQDPKGGNKIPPKSGQSEPAPTNAPWKRMDDKWSNNFLLDSSSTANHGGYLSCFALLPTNTPNF